MMKLIGPLGCDVTKLYLKLLSYCMMGLDWIQFLMLKDVLNINQMTGIGCGLCEEGGEGGGGGGW